MTTLTRLKIAALEECSRIDVRAKLSTEAVTDYAEAYEAGAVIPPIVVFQEKGCERWIIADGRHRLAAARKLGIRELDVDLREGNEHAALKHAVQCNVEHGLRRSKADLRVAFRRFMADLTLSRQYTGRERADLFRVSSKTLQRLEVEWRDEPSATPEEAEAKDWSKRKANKFKPKASSAEPDVDNDAGLNPIGGQLTTSEEFGDLPTLEERVDEHARAEEEYVRSVAAVMESDDRLAAAQAEIKRQAAEIAAVKISRDGYLNGKAAVTKLLKKEQAKVASLGKRLDESRAIDARPNSIRLLELARDLPNVDEFVASGAEIRWADVERLHDWLTELLENR